MYKLKDFAQDISVAIKDAQTSPFDRFVGLEHYDSGEPVITRYTDKSLLSSSVKEFRKNDILIARRNVYLKRAGIAFFDGLTSGDSIVLRIFEDCEKRTGIPQQDAIRIIPFILNSNAFWAYANKHADGMNSKRISKEMLYDYEFDLPPLAEQKVLADKLWAAYRLKQSYKKLLAATEEMVKSQFIEMFGTVQANGTLTEKMTVEEISEQLFAGGDKPKDASDVMTDEYRYPIIANGIGESGIIGYSKSYRVDKDSLTVSARGTIGYCSIRKPYFTPVVRLITIIPKKCIHLLYLKYYFEYVGFEYTGAIQGQLTIPLLKEKKVLVPPMELQQQFVSIAEQADKSGFVAFPPPTIPIINTGK